MLGKANEVKTIYLEGFTQGFNLSDCGLPENAIVIDIKFSTSYEQNYGVHQSALIIYKEDMNFPSELEEAYKRIHELEERNKGLE